MTPFDLTKHLLRGRFGQVANFRKQQPKAWKNFPLAIIEVADRFLGAGRGDKSGREVLTAWLEETKPYIS